jgi:hypothetical protein
VSPRVKQQVEEGLLVPHQTAAMALTLSVPSVNHSVQQHARALHTNLSQQLGTPTDLTAPPAASIIGTTTASATELRQLVSCNAKLARALARSNTDLTAVEDADELQAACQQRQELLSELLQTLDSSLLGLRSQLDACHKLLHTLPCKEDPEMIIRYAHTLRHAFAPLGSAPGLPPVPPAPQVPFMLHSALRLYHMDVVAQKAGQQQPGQQLPEAPAIPQVRSVLHAVFQDRRGSAEMSLGCGLPCVLRLPSTYNLVTLQTAAC